MLQTPDIRLVAIDLDGTLLNDSREVSQRTASALGCLRDRGTKVVIASARPPRSVRRFYRHLELDTWQINYNGALIWDEQAGEAVHHQPMACDVVLGMIAEARHLFPDVLVSCEILDRWYTDRLDDRYATQTAKLFGPDLIAPIESFCNQPITKLMFLGPGPMMRAVRDSLAERFGRSVSIIHSEEELLQIMDRRAGKAIALQRVAGHYGIPMSQVMAIGDALNDVEMLQAAGVAIAMDNAYPELKRLAHWVAPSNNDHGVHAALQRYRLCD